MKLEDIKPSQVLVSIPLVHAGIATLFLFSYCAGFGAKISDFIAPLDIFRISISDLLSTYVLSFSFPAFIVINRLTKFHAKNSITQINPPKQLQKATGFQGFISNQDNLIIIMMITVMPLVAYKTLQAAHANEAVLAVPIGILLTLLFSMWLWTVQERLQLSYTITELLRLGIISVVLCAANGLDKGQSDRHMTYAMATDQYASCGQVRIIRHFSDLYLAVTSSGQKVMIDGDCKTKFTIPDPKPMSIKRPFSYLPGLG